MKVLSIDPGAERMGWAVLEDGPVYIESGVVYCPRLKNENYQPYRLRLMNHSIGVGDTLMETYHPDILVSEIVPAPNHKSPGGLVQRALATASITVIQVIAYLQDIPVVQVSANTIKQKIGGKGDATKVRVRNGVMQLLPELKGRIKDWVNIFEEPDAIATGLTHMGYSKLKPIDFGIILTWRKRMTCVPKRFRIIFCYAIFTDTIPNS